MRIKYKMVLLILLPMLVVIGAIAAIVFVQEKQLAAQQTLVLEESLLESKRAEIMDYVSLARTSIDLLYSSGRNDEATKEQVKAILRTMNFGQDGYFFVYDTQGLCLVHPRQTELEGRQMWDKRDPTGFPVIQKLIEAAQQGGGFQRYLWIKPTSGKETDKLAYAVLLDRWGWMMGTGIYLDDVAAAKAKISQESDKRIHGVMRSLAVTAVLAILIVVACAVAVNLSEQRSADAKLTAMARRVVTSQEDERTRIARELHDGISQQLVSTKYQIELAQFQLPESDENRAAQQALEKGLDGLGDTIAEIRRISHDLRSSLLDNLGLPAALGQLANDVAAHTGLEVRVDVSRCQHKLPDTPAITLFRIAQEALTNIVKHAAARQVDLLLSSDRRSVALTITDDGRGFAPEAETYAQSGGIGLRNMRERAELEGGSLHIVSQPGHTVLLATLPLSEAG
ncbi:cache domain-containing protein [Chitinimonas sp.]|uniref:cache domain-containing protein n=1 Tax=Chitinimonas sp. TaxID=1934313 RepID=UPI002F91DD8A